MSGPATGADGGGLRGYLAVTAAYWGFTLSDGALRMLVLLHFWRLGFTPFTLALLFVLYEAAGIFANLAGGWLAARFGTSRMLAAGLLAQIAGFLLLAALPADADTATAVLWVFAAQGICGVAKDVTKTASKSAIKLTAGADAGRLFRWVAWFTGSKNAMKGAGFFLGGVLLEALGFRGALWALAAALGGVLCAAIATVPVLGAGRAGASRSVREFLSKNRGVNLLALARIFLFGARDVWFVVGVPVYLAAAGWSMSAVGGFLALWTIGYGLVQGLAPQLVARSADGLSAEVPAARRWSAALVLVPLALALAIGEHAHRAPLLVAGLVLFGAVFAVLSSLHSYLILAYAGSKKAAEDVGFYYAANACGRLAGTLLSGALYAAGGVRACLLAAAILAGVSLVASLRLPAHAAAEAR
jgi:predicted MFS family arabinose efflux permease